MDDEFLDDEQLKEWIEARMLSEADEASSPEKLIESIDEAETLLRLVRTAWPKEDATEEQESTSSDEQTDSPTFGRFQIKRLLGHGGMGTVFLARDPILNRDVALKVPHPGIVLNAKARKRFLREARAAGSMRHPNIVGVYESGEVNGICYTASEYCDGPSLRDWLNQHKVIDYHAAARIVGQLASAIAHAHEKGVVHRDLKPSNIMFESSTVTGREAPGEGNAILQKDFPFLPRITDFGLAQVAEESGAAPLTKTGALFGSAEYMSPEQASGNGGVGPASDIHALGVILYESLTGKRPFWRENLETTVIAVQRIVPKSFKSCGLNVPTELEDICFRCLEKNPANRYPSALALHDDLQSFSAIRRGADRRFPSTSLIKRRLSRGPLIVVCVCLMLIVFGSFTLINDHSSLGSAFKNQSLDYGEFVHLAYNAWHRDNIDPENLLAEIRTNGEQGQLEDESYVLVSKIARRAGNRLYLGHDGAVRDIAKVPGTEFFISVGDDGTIRQWTIDSKEPYRILDRPDLVDEPNDELNAVAISPDGKWLVTGHRTVELWNLESGEITKLLTRHNSPIESLAFSPDGTMIASAARNNDIRVVSADEGILATLPGGSQTGSLNQCVSFSPDGESIFALYRTKSKDVIRSWSCQTFEKIRDYSAPLGQYDVFAIEPTTEILAAAGNDRLLHMVRLHDERRLAATDTFDQRITALSFSPAGSTFACIGNDGRLHYWKTQLLAVHSSGLDAFGDADYSVSAHAGIACDLEFWDEDRILTCAEDGSIKLWDLAANDRWNRMKFSESPTSVEVSNSGELIAVGYASSGYVLLYDRRSDEQAKIDVRKTGAWRMSFSEDDRWIAISDESHIVMLINCKSKETIRPNVDTPEVYNLPKDLSVIPPPTDLTVTSADSQQITLTWKAPANAKVTHYHFCWKCDQEDWQTVRIDENLSQSMTYMIEAANGNTLYTFHLYAFNGVVISKHAELNFLVGQRHF